MFRTDYAGSRRAPACRPAPAVGAAALRAGFGATGGSTANGRPAPARRVDVDRPLHQKDPLPHAEQAEATVVEVGIEATPIVAHGHRDAPVALHDAHFHPCRARVLDDVAEGLLYQPVEGADIRREPRRRPVAVGGERHAEVYLHTRQAPHPVHQRLDRRLESEIVEGGAKLGDQALKARDGVVDVADGALTTCSACWPVPRCTAASSMTLSAPSSCNVSSWSSRAQRPRSCSAA